MQVEDRTSEIMPLNSSSDSSDILKSGPEWQRFPFLFAKRFGVVVVAYEDGEYLLATRSNVSVEALAEARRFLGGRIKVEKMDDPTFNQALTLPNQNDSSEAMQMVEG